MGILVDLVLLAIIITSAVIGWKKGVFRSVMRLGSVIAAVVGAIFLKDTVSQFLNNVFFQPKIANFIYNSYERTIGENVPLDKLFKELPAHFTKWVNSYSTVNEATAWYSGKAEATVKDFSNAIAEPISDKISVVVAFVLVFLVLFFLIRLICFICDKFLKLPVLNAVNKFFGLLLGVAAGICIAWVAAEVFRAGLPDLSKINPGFEGADKNSVFLEILCNFNPLTLFKLLG